LSSIAVSGGADTADDALALAQRTLAYVEKTEKRPAMAAELNALTQRLTEAKETAARAVLEKEIRALRRRILFSHPDLSFNRLLACQRNLPYSHATHMVDQYVGRYSRAGGAGLIVIDDWKTVPKKHEILKGKLPSGTTLNPDLNWDADRVLFAFCDHTDRRTLLQKLIPVYSETLGRKISRTNSSVGRSVNRVDPTNPMFDDEPFNHPATAFRYFIYEAALDGSWVRQLTGTEKDAMTTWEGRQTVLIEDVDPCYLPDGGFAFTYGIRCVGGNVWAGGTSLPHNYFNTFNTYRIDGVEETHFTPGRPHILCARRDRPDQLTIPVALGSYFWPAGRSYNGKIGEVLAYDRILTETELQAVENYLSEKWLGRTLHAQAEKDAKAKAVCSALAEVDVGKEGTLDLNGKNLTVAALSGSGRIINSSSAPATLTVTGASAFTGEVAANVRLAARK